MAAVTAQSPRDINAELKESSRVVALLQRPEFYPEKTRSVELIETHISWIFLTDEFAYKLKKPVRFDFLDFSTAELRRAACLNEVKLNRRLAPGVYLGVVPISESSRGHLCLGQHGTPVDWVVKMRRLPAENALDAQIRSSKVSPAAIERLAKMLSDFYDKVPPVTMTVDRYRENIEHHVIANRDELAAAAHHLDLSEIRCVYSAQLRILRLAPDMLDERVRNGRIIEGHGDLRPEHVYFNPSPLVIDCIEFNREFRTLDVVDELAFLAMECDFLGAEGLTDTIFARYFERSGDAPPRQLIDFYRIYRACVRAKVSALRAEQLAGEARSRLLASAGKYLDLAVRYAHTLAPPLLVVVHGLPGTGKSTIARTISEDLGFELLQTDAIRRSMFASDGDRPDFDKGRYHPENRLRVYEAMHEEAASLLSRGTSVVLDGTYLTASLRRAAADLAERSQAEFLALHCCC
ncbi:MAG: AAA family ATPase, partial [Planctomycetota bacterium]